MTPEQFVFLLEKKRQDLERYSMAFFPKKAANTALRFVDGNFRAQGYQGNGFSKWKKNKSNTTVLVKSGALRAAMSYSLQPGQATIINRMAYAKVHNEGFKGTLTVKAHTRNKYSKARVGTGKLTKTGKERMQTVTMKTGQTKVKSHIRNVNIPQRQFMPINGNDSPILNRAIERFVKQDLLNIITT